MDTSKRTRAPNWDNTEKALLKELITEEVKIIECKQTDTNTNKAKTKAWQKIHNRFTELNGRGRNFMELKQQWRCMKLDAKKSISAHRQAMSKTGGGPKPPSPSKDTLELAELLPLEFEVDHNEFDSDSLPVTVVVTTEDNISVALDDDADVLGPLVTQRVESINNINEVEYDDSTSNPALPTSMKNTPKRGGIVKNNKRKMRFQDEEYTASIKKLAEERSAQLLHEQHEEHLLRMKNLQQEMEMKQRERDMKEELHAELMKCAATKTKINSIKYEILKLKKDFLLRKQ